MHCSKQLCASPSLRPTPLAHNMNDEDIEKILGVTHRALKSQLGTMGDLPYEVANTVANVHFRFFQPIVDSAPPISTEELLTRRAEYESMPRAVSAHRTLLQKGAHQSLIDY